MTCPSGEHSHSDGHGGWRGCHDINEEHRNPLTQQAHEQALANGGARQAYNEFKEGEQERKVPIKRGTRHDAVLNALGYGDLVGKDYTTVIVRLFNGVKNLSMFKHIFPLASAINGMNRLASIYSQMEGKRINTNSKKGFLKGWNALDSVFDGDMNPDDVRASLDDVEGRIRELEKDPKTKKKGSVEYSEFMAYKAFLSSYNSLRRRENEIENILIIDPDNDERAKQFYKKLKPSEKEFIISIRQSLKSGGKNGITVEQKEQLKSILQEYMQYKRTHSTPESRDIKVESEIKTKLKEHTRGLSPDQRQRIIEEARRRSSNPSVHIA